MQSTLKVIQTKTIKQTKNFNRRQPICSSSSKPIRNYLEERKKLDVKRRDFYLGTVKSWFDEELDAVKKLIEDVKEENKKGKDCVSSDTEDLTTDELVSDPF